LQFLTWKAPNGVCHLVAECLQHNGFVIVQDQHCEIDNPLTVAVWESVASMEMKNDKIEFDKLSEEVKINQFPGLYAIGRKDCLAKCFQKMVEHYGTADFNFIPKTFIIDDDKDKLVEFMETFKKPMIVKPPNWFNGMGIKLINKIGDIPSTQSKAVVQEYIDNPFLINGLKFDLRLYVLMTSIDPIKLYIYEDGIVNFCSVKYTNEESSLGNKFIHFTNYSINKTNSDYLSNSSPGDYTGHKWTLATLWKYFDEVLCIDWRPVWEKTKEICLKTVLCGHQHIKKEFGRQVNSEYNCYKLFGFDVLFDADLKPWLLEVNNNAPLLENTVDAFVNRGMLAEMFNIVGFHMPRGSAIQNLTIKHDSRLYSRLETKEGQDKIHCFKSSPLGREFYLENILEELSPFDVRTILRSAEELSQTKSWTRIFPATKTHQYLHFLSSPLYSDLLMDAWEHRFGSCDWKRREGHELLKSFCEKEHHLKVPDIDSDLSRFPLRFSLFSNVPPYIRFLLPDQEYEPPLPEELQYLTWIAPGCVSPIVSECVKKAGFSIVEVQVRKKENQVCGSIWDCLPVTEKEKDELFFDGFNSEVKINQFPGLFVIGRKDSLSLCYEEMVRKFGALEFDFLPKTYILPDDKDELITFMRRTKKPMIMKPPNWFCGIGIKLINKIEDIPSKENKMVVQEYIDNPFLIRGLKFDLRLYVLMTSIDPIKVYMFEEGLVRFATTKYTNNPDDISNNFIHLTNYSVNKESDEFVYNESPGNYSGHKWNLATLWKYFDEVLCIDWRPVWEKTKEICLKTVLCGHQHIKKEVGRQVNSEYNCYKLFGFDVFYDSNLKPWLLEVNNIPSLHVNTIDSYVNIPMVVEMFNIVGFHIPKDTGCKHQKKIKKDLNLSKFEIDNIAFDERLYSKLKSEEDLKKQNRFISDQLCREHYIKTILDNLSSYDIRTIIRSEDEFSQTKSWTRIFPTSTSHNYLQLLSAPSYSDRLLDAWECKYGSDEENRNKGVQFLNQYCEEKHHLKVSSKKPNKQKLITRKAVNEDDQSKTAWMETDVYKKFQ